MKRFLSLLFVLVVFFLQANAQCGVHCGTERWKVKTLTDSTVGTIDPTETSKTIKWVRQRTFPVNLPADTRLVGIERMTFKIRGEVLRFKREDDHDIHVVIANPNKHSETMVIEFTDKNCANVCSSTFLPRMRKARADFEAQFGNATGSFQTPDQPTIIEVVGIGFFDRPHGQSGMAPSNMELHPVLSMRVVN